ncbi:methylated-DNA--[protein]-cysteine S-methyltransferase [Clostridium tertium]|jgi:methylated-DNA-[protein]-cysteine S-methyltransferase|uniref:methylated-DNA--[protein]-cysteine S-methyltransferase n=1 Tax=Clostridium tertium TaxID=1559 RepID=A0A9X3XMF4_9CLOT|nr:methylated-DNA--[protein]-cysteine S-methyltransferase [Clostridium tertium]MBU6136943.1 methylated-DNA--[protein]-cysteine S-methyltransferase [Clostridium tertium]MDC4241276.1 methylated-DNA--[protein]-cysteine S-methyltransferase [Clostridium tertium]
MENCREKLYFYKIDSIIGSIYIVKSLKGLRGIELIEEEWIKFKGKNNLIEDKKICLDVITQLNEYFAGERRDFDLKLDIEGTEFRKLVWNELIKIPYGEIKSYSYIAKAIGNEKAVRAIGQANRANPIPIVIPCHRVAGKNGKLIGYAGNHTDIQEKLIKFEKRFN